MGSGRPRGRLNGVDVKPEILRHARVRAGLSLAQVAGGELTRQAVHLIETGKVRPSMNSLRVITSRLAVPIQSVLVQPASSPRSDESLDNLEALVRGHHYDRAVEHGRELLETAESPLVIARVNHYLGHALLRLNQPWKALDRLRVARDMLESASEMPLVVKTMGLQARALHLAQDRRALEVAEQALARCRSLEPPLPEAESDLLQWIGGILTTRNEHVKARAYFDEALQAAGNVRDLGQMARIYHGLGLCYYGVGDLGRAIDLVLKAETLYEAQVRVSGAPPNVELPRVENDLGLLFKEQGDLSRAESRIESAISRLVALGADRMRGNALLSLAEVRERQDRFDEGVSLVKEAIELAQRFNEPRTLATAYKQLGELHAALGKYDLAVPEFQRALAILEEEGLEQRRVECQQAYERAMARRHQADAAASA